MKTWTLIALAVLACCAVTAAVVALLFLPVRQEITEVSTPEQPVTEEQPVPDEAAGTGIEWESDTVANLLMTSSAGWAAHMTGVEVVTVLRRPVVRVSTDIGPEQADLADEFASGIAGFASGLADDEGDPYTYCIQILSSEGDAIGMTKVTDERWALDAPPVPTGAKDLAAWLETVYGSGSAAPESWMTRIAGVHEAAGNKDAFVVIRTDLDPSSSEDQLAAQTIIDAVNSSGAAFAPGIRVVFGDGESAWESLLDGIDPYGP
ncbi:MAG: hypothetical protein EG823_06170 [Actinobacteria bacterium]|nr:hypothetical protein [Actinomycetota bacterium]